ncbi:MAG: hypothetical protein V4805_03900 [Pseudomonadota bacterium]
MSSAAATHEFTLHPIVAAVLVILFCVAAAIFISESMPEGSTIPTYVGAVHA